MNPFDRWASGLCSGAVWIFLLAAAATLYPIEARAGGSRLNVLVVANQSSSNSLELANYYREQREVPPGNLLRIAWNGSNVEWTPQDFTNMLLNPVLAFVEQNQLSNQIQYVVLSMDIPYRITGSPGNSTTAALFYGFKAGAGFNNSYALSENRFAVDKPDTAPTNSFLTMMLTADTLEEAKRMIDQGIAGDQTSPTQHTWLVKSDDTDRNKRFKDFDNAIFNARLCDDYCLFRTNSVSAPPWTNLLGCELGLANFSVSSNTFIPGAIADSMTSFGGQIFEASGQTTLLEFVQAGASGSYGTVSEPLPLTTKFPNPMVYFYQARGFSLAECYYQSVEQPYQGLFVGEPLAAPWREKFNGGWLGLSENAPLQGTTNLCLNFSDGSTGRTIERIDLFLNGRPLQTLTNIPPQPGNRLTVNLKGHGVNYDVPTNATIKTIATGLTAELNKSINTNITKVTARAFGDRIELQSFAAPLPDGIFEFIDDEGTTNTTYLAVPGPYSRASTVSTPGLNGTGELRVQFATDPGVSNVLQASTNFIDWIPVSSNAAGGLMEFLETEVSLYPQRFYRVAVPSPNPTPSLDVVGLTASHELMLQVTGPTNRPYVIQASPNFIGWTDLLTNSLGGDGAFLDPNVSSKPTRYYRTRSADTNDYESVSVDPGPVGNTILVTDGSPGEILVWSSTNATDWVPVYSYAGSPGVQTQTGNSSGSGEPVTTRLDAADPLFLDSTAQGIRKFGVELDFFGPPTLSDSSYLNLQVTKTNAMLVSLTVTNPPGNTDMEIFVNALVDAINVHPELTSTDGADADDVIAGFPGQFLFNLRARAEGRLAAEIQAHLTGSSDLLLTPNFPVMLDENITDLLPRNHLYVSAGVPSLTHYFDLDTTTLPDGYHELTAVAYEGTHVHSQTLTTTSIIVSNTTLHPTLVLQSASSTNLVDSSFDFQVSANTNSVSLTQLFTTGGLYDTRTNETTSTFTVSGQDLGVGEHPFHALVTTTNGFSYRTEKVSVTLTK